jgi:cardiolipin synthase
VRRLLGLDRSAPPPKEVLPGEPLNPWTLPNLVGYLRLAALPVFLYLGFESGDGRSAAAAALYWLIAAGDYLDGLLARATGQYSRLGTVLDPVVDRLTILSGAVVCWHFELLPRWALALLALREAFMLWLTRLAFKRGLDLEINMLGRWAVWPVMSALALALIWDSWVPEACLYVGLILTLGATAEYVAAGLRAVRGESPSSSA